MRSFVGDRAIRIVMVATSTAALAGCSSRYVPGSGPDFGEVQTKAALTINDTNADIPYILINISQSILSKLPQSSDVNLGSIKILRKSKYVTLGIGDKLGVTIYEAGAGGLFTTTEDTSNARSVSSHKTELPDQAVDSQGNISVPYAGQIRAAGRSISAIQNDIVEKLKNRAVEPQVIVSVREQYSNQVSVLGDVNGPGLFSIGISGFTILEAIAKAGGIKSSAHETRVYLQRGTNRGRINFLNLINNSDENIPILSGDVVFVAKEPRFYSVAGAVNGASRIAFDSNNLNLADALARAEGLADDRADPGMVAVYRFEDRAVFENMGLKIDPSLSKVPTLYRLNLADAQGYFLAKQFYIQSSDIIYIGNATSVEVTKFFRSVNSVTLPLRDVFIIDSLLSRGVIATPVAVGP